ncbi:MAG: TonB-dependent receptor [Gammaproteobacteria bacterium]|nr:TonB-dependent receptor [Gammaproteobacteria bacterium]
MQLEVVSASLLPQSRELAPALISVVTAEDIQLMGLRSLAELLDYSTEMQALSGINSARTLSVRGTSLQDGVLVMINGQAVNNPFLGNFNFYDMPLYGVSRVEIRRGPGSSLYGGNALLAVIDIQTRRNLDRERGMRAAGGNGSRHGREYFGEWLQDLGDYLPGLVFSGGYGERGSDGDALRIERDSLFSPQPGRFLPPITNPSLAPDERREHPEQESGYFNLDWADFSASYQYLRSRSTPLLSSQAVVTDEGDSLRVEALNSLQLSYAWELSADLRITPRLYHVLNQSKTLGDSEPAQFIGDVNQDGFNEAFPSGIIESYIADVVNSGAEIQFDWRLSEGQHLAFGFIRERARLEEAEKQANVSRLDRGILAIFPVQDMTREFIDPDIERRQRSFYAEYFWQWHDHWRMTLGARYDDYSDFGSTTTPRFSLVYTPNSRTSLKLLYGEAFKPANFIQLFDRTPALSPFRIQGNPDLLPTEIKTAEAQLSYRFSEAWELAFNLFHSRLDNEIAFDSTPGIRRWQNAGAHRTQGGSLELAAHLPWAPKLFANYSYYQSSGLSGTPDGQTHPRHRFNAGGHFALGDRFQGFAGLRHYSRAERERGDGREAVPSKTYVDLSLQLKDLWQEARAALTVKNVFDAAGRDELEASLGVVDDLPRPGREIWLSLELPLW